ncbi:MAG: peptidylprolyl isomerase [Methylococcaceae bacterium]
MNNLFCRTMLIGTIALSGCSGENGAATPPSFAADQTNAVANVNGTYIPKKSLEMLEKEVQVRARGMKVPQDKLVDELVSRELLVQEAEKNKLSDTDEVKEQLYLSRRSVLSQAVIQKYLKDNPVTDDDIKTEYEKNYGQAKGGKEFKASHILVKTEDTAKEVVKELQKGGSFAKLAQKYSLDPTKSKGGDLGWFAPDRMVPEFSKAVGNLKDGEYTATPVKTQFGYHIIQRDSSRAQTPPPFASVKEQMKPMVERVKLQQYLKDMREQAKVEVLLKKPETPAPKAIPDNAGKGLPKQPDINPAELEKAKEAAAKAVKKMKPE